MPSLVRGLNDAPDIATAGECVEELIALQRIAAAETDPEVFRAQQDEPSPFVSSPSESMARSAPATFFFATFFLAGFLADRLLADC
jgi:hypothetical protein